MYVAEHLTVRTWKCMRCHELQNVELLLLWDLLEESSEASSLLILCIEHSNYIWLLDEHLARLYKHLKLRKEIDQTYTVAIAFNIVESLFK